MKNVEQLQDFWFIDDHLVIPAGQNVWETLFHLTHDQLGHFGSQKAYKMLCKSFYWPNMCQDLESTFLPVLTVNRTNQ